MNAFRGLKLGVALHQLRSDLLSFPILPTGSQFSHKGARIVQIDFVAEARTLLLGRLQVHSAQRIDGRQMN